MKSKETWKKSVSLKDLEKKASLSPLKTFETCDILEIRQACLKRLNEDNFFSVGENHLRAEWAETCIQNLHPDDWEIKNGLFEWYIFSSDGENFSRAISFALEINNKQTIYPLAKWLAGALTKPGKAWKRDEIPRLREFLEKIIKSLSPKPGYSLRRYSDFEWINVERAIKIINHQKDSSFIPIFDQIIADFRDGKIKVDPSPEALFKDKIHLDYLIRTRELLQETGLR